MAVITTPAPGNLDFLSHFTKRLFFNNILSAFGLSVAAVSTAFLNVGDVNNSSPILTVGVRLLVNISEITCEVGLTPGILPAFFNT